MKVPVYTTITMTCVALALTGADSGYAQTVSLAPQGNVYAGYVRIPRDEIVSHVRALLGGLEVQLHTFGDQHGTGRDISWFRNDSFVAGIPGGPKEKLDEIKEDEPFKWPGLDRYLKHYIDNVKSDRVVVVPVGTSGADLRLDIHFGSHGREIRGRCITKRADGTWGRCTNDMERDIELRDARLRTHLKIAPHAKSATLTVVGRPAFTFDLQIKNWNCQATNLGKAICDHIESKIRDKVKPKVEDGLSARLKEKAPAIASAFGPLLLARIAQEIHKYPHYAQLFKDGVPWEVTDVTSVNVQVGQGLVPYFNFWVRRPAPARADPGPLTLLGVDLQPYVNVPASSELPFTLLTASPVEVSCPAQVRLKGILRSKGRPGQVSYRYRWQHGPLSTVFVAKVASATWNPQYDSKGVLTHYETEVSQEVTVPLPPALSGGSTPGGLKQGPVGGSHEHRVRIEVVDGPVSGWKPYHLVCKSTKMTEAPRRAAPPAVRVDADPKAAPTPRRTGSAPSPTQQPIRTSGAPDLLLLDGFTLGTRATSIPWGETATLSTGAAFSKRAGRCSFRYRYGIANQGQRAAGPIVALIRLNAPDGPVLAKDAISGLPAGGRQVASGVVALPAGTSILYVHVDADDQVAESDERNNLRRVRVELDGNCR